MPDGNVASLEKDLSPHEIHFCLQKFEDVFEVLLDYLSSIILLAFGDFSHSNLEKNTV